MVENISGDLLSSDCQYICHQVNCKGKMNSGIAKSIREKWPHVFSDYLSKVNGCHPHSPLGDIQIVELRKDSNTNCLINCVINMFAQSSYGYDGKQYTSYDAFWSCLQKISAEIPDGATIGFPKNIGCCRGGANRNVILAMITESLGNKYHVKIYDYNGG